MTWPQNMAGLKTEVDDEVDLENQMNDTASPVLNSECSGCEECYKCDRLCGCVTCNTDLEARDAVVKYFVIMNKIFSVLISLTSYPFIVYYFIETGLFSDLGFHPLVLFSPFLVYGVFQAYITVSSRTDFRHVTIVAIGGYALTSMLIAALYWGKPDVQTFAYPTYFIASVQLIVNCGLAYILDNRAQSKGHRMLVYALREMHERVLMNEVLMADDSDEEEEEYVEDDEDLEMGRFSGCGCVTVEL